MKMSQSLKVNALGIGIFAAITAALIAITFVLTKAPIAENIRKQKSAKLFEIIGDTATDNDIFAQTITLDGSTFGYSNNIKAHLAMYKGEIKSIVFPVISPAGYSGNITLLVGVNAYTIIAGVRVVTHTVTPGLGDKLELKKSPWVLAFNDLKKTPEQRWAVKKDGGDFDQFTGATITPRAVVNAVGKTLDYVMLNRDTLFTYINNNTNTGTQTGSESNER